MSEYLIHGETLKALGDKIRSMSNSYGKMSLEAMLNKLDVIASSGSQSGNLSGIKDEIAYKVNDTGIGKAYFQPPIIVSLDNAVEWDSSVSKYRIYGVIVDDIVKLSLPTCTTFDDPSSGIPNVSFSGGKIQELDLPLLTSVYESMFSDCVDLETVNLPACVSIGYDAFCRCAGLESINLPACTSIGSYAFQDCSNLSSVSLPLCSEIGGEAFSGTAIETLELPSLSIIPGTHDSNMPFTGMANLKHLFVPAATEIYSYAFNNNTTLVSISADNCTEIGESAFTDCDSLETASFSSCETIDTGAFEGCSALETITLSTACTIAQSAFEHVLDPDNKVLKMFFVADENETIAGTQSGESLFGEINSNIGSGSGSGSGNGDEPVGGETDPITSVPIPGLEIYVPAELVDRFKAEWCGGRYAENVYEMPEEQQEES